MEEKVLYNATVVLPVKNGKVLLARKTRKIGEGCWNGYGGGIDDGEDEWTTAVRELKEESGGLIGNQFGLDANPADLEKVATIDFHNTKADGEIFVTKVHFYLLRNWKGEAVSTEEMDTPTWFAIENIPSEEMMPADRIFFPLILSGKKVVGEAFYRNRQKEMYKDFKYHEVDTL